jgi:hypothetical protein
VDADLAEIVVEARLHVGAGVCIQGIAGGRYSGLCRR